MGRFAKNLTLVLAVAAASLLLGLLSNALRREPLPLLYRNREARMMKTVSSGNLAAFVEPEILDLKQALLAQKDSSVLFVDARESDFFGEGHIPGAVNLPREDILLAKTKVIPGDEARRLVVYCSGEDCEDARIVAKGLSALGYSKVSVYAGGWEEWTASGAPVQK